MRYSRLASVSTQRGGRPTILVCSGDVSLRLQHSIMEHASEEHKKHLKNVGPIRHCEPPHAHSPGVASGTVARRLRIDVHDDNENDNA